MLNTINSRSRSRRITVSQNTVAIQPRNVDKYDIRDTIRQSRVKRQREITKRPSDKQLRETQKRFDNTIKDRF